MQSLIKIFYPSQCVMCEARTEVDFALCGPCWAETPFIDGLCCDGCGSPLPGQGEPEAGILCDDCMVVARPWSKGRAAMIYKEKARRLVLSLKHGDRTDLTRAAGPWLARAAKPLITVETLIVPVPLHRFRLLRRKFNQAALLAGQAAAVAGVQYCPDALIRRKKTAPLEGHTRDQRFEALSGAIVPNPKRMALLNGRKVLLIDDVMTSGATFAAATEACYSAGVDDVCVLALARVVKDA
ncbi:ComF/GntX family-like protein [Octadecabacter arcticus 238]|jgi:predicted amidophosphoribosyltransferase|uniref:ComF/GntX family-like protein n=1 Tax=Octadecabacter arcticus 238 TaxID=391616 RepID=M9RRI4_9RHOB|nr:double zinc ribbon domain-containing protein [Octadecabacter arcticus]AGI74338.1 ComF/GntX family-like protein [Octadecabacter arcticus 238]